MIFLLLSRDPVKSLPGRTVLFRDVLTSKGSSLHRVFTKGVFTMCSGFDSYSAFEFKEIPFFLGPEQKNDPPTKVRSSGAVTGRSDPERRKLY